MNRNAWPEPREGYVLRTHQADPLVIVVARTAELRPDTTPHDRSRTTPPSPAPLTGCPSLLRRSSRILCRALRHAPSSASSQITRSEPTELPLPVLTGLARVGVITTPEGTHDSLRWRASALIDERWLVRVDDGVGGSGSGCTGGDVGGGERAAGPARPEAQKEACRSGALWAERAECGREGDR